MNKIKNFFLSLYFAFSFLTILPLPFNKKIRLNDEIISFNPFFYPLVGLFYGIISFYLAKLFIYLNIDFNLTTLIIIIFQYGLNKFLHFDGLCDLLDAFLADKTKEERLVILKDSRIGSFALGGAVLYLLLRFFIMRHFILLNNLLPYLIIIPVLSRFSMIFLSYRSRYPRKEGTGSFIIGKIKNVALISTILLSFLIMTIFTLITANYITAALMLLISFLFVIIFSLLFKLYSYKKIGGVTGDVLGALNEIIELSLPLLLIIIQYHIK